MRSQYSEAVDRYSYRDDGLANGIQLRVHRDQYKEINGALRLQQDWSRLVSPVSNWHGGLADRFNFISVTIPDCLPERLEIISYGNEYAWLYDDEMEKLDLKQFEAGRDDILRVFSLTPHTADSNVTMRPEKTIQMQIFDAMKAIDSERATTAMAAWARFVHLASQTRTKPFKTLEQYLPSRAIDAGELLFYGMLTFGLALTIPASEVETCMRLARPAYEAISLVNDIYSWPKEKVEAQEAGPDSLFNAVWVVMKEQGCDEEAALRICRETTQQRFEQFCDIVKGSEALGLSPQSQRYLDAVRQCHVGNLVWSIYCPRYQSAQNSAHNQP